MRNVTRTYLIAVMLILGLAAFATAQMMGGGQGEGKQMMDSTMHKQGGMNMMDMVHTMNNRCDMMSNNFDSLQTHFAMMMKMDDMAALKKEMQKHQMMMQNMHKDMSQQHELCQNMMSMMHSGDMGGMMKKDNESSDEGN